jgi:hypothetical protein
LEIYQINFKISILKALIYNTKFISFRIFLVTLSLFCATNLELTAQIDSLFQSDEIISMELRSDFSALQYDRVENPVYRSGDLIYYSTGGDTTKLPVKVMVRGHFRRDPKNCYFPPLSVNFKIDEVKNTLFDNQDKLKLVTPCQNEEDVLEEYLIYKMYNQVTDLSMKVRLVKILYYDTGKGKEVFVKYSFFTEEKEHIAERNNAFAKDRFVTPFDLNSDNVKKISVFQYIIGNSDWQFTSRHNIIIMQPNDTTLAPYAVPYDFDFSGFVNAVYTKPKGVPDEFLASKRVYKGLCYTNDEFKDIFEFYLKLKPKFESIINNMGFLSKSKRKERIRYINYFYTVINSSELFKRDFLDVCKTEKDYNIIDK